MRVFSRDACACARACDEESGAKGARAEATGFGGARAFDVDQDKRADAGYWH